MTQNPTGERMPSGGRPRLLGYVLWFFLPVVVVIAMVLLLLWLTRENPEQTFQYRVF